MPIKLWINPLLLGLLILFSLPLKLPALQHWLENLLSITFPVRLSLYTFFLPPTALLCLFWNRGRITEIWDKLRSSLVILLFLFCWMWSGAIMSDYPGIALKHSGRYSIMLLTFLALLFALDRNSIKKCGQIFTAIYVFLMALTFLDWHGKISIPDLISDFGLHIDLFYGDYPGEFRPDHFVTSFFENRNPYAVASVAVFFWSLANLRYSLILSSVGIGTALYSIFLAQSRNGILTLIICLLILLYLSFRQIRTQSTVLAVVLAASIAVVISFFSLHSQAISRTSVSFNKLLNVESFKDLEKLDIRFTIFRAALESGMTNPPILGSGTKTFGHEVFSKEKDLAHFNNKHYKDIYNSHNFLLTVWIEMGWVGLIAALIFLWLWFRPAMRGPPMLMMPMLAVCVGQIFDYFIWEIFFMAFQSFFFAHFASSMYFVESKNTVLPSEDTDS